MIPKINPADFNTVSTLDNDNDNNDIVTYLCSYCNTKLYYQSTDELTGKKIYLCIKCNIEYIPANQLVRKSSRFETPQGPNKSLLTATPIEDIEGEASQTKYIGKQNLPPLFKALEGQGLKFTHYEEH
jgi:hypothetical protein